MSFRKSLLISAAVHIIILILLPGHRPSVREEDWVEVSLSTFPEDRERIPDRVPGEEGVFEPSLPAHEAERRDLPVEAEEIFAGVPVSEARPEIESEEPERILPVRETERRPRISPGRREGTGSIREEGEDDDFMLSGPVARREVLRRVYPEYPSWAQEQGVEGTVRLRFWVSSDGLVENVEMESTSGYPEMDSRAIEAMKKWLFEADESEESQWGRISIRYSLR